MTAQDGQDGQDGQDAQDAQDGQDAQDAQDGQDFVIGHGSIHDMRIKLKKSQVYSDLQFQEPGEAILLLIGLLCQQNPDTHLAYNIYRGSSARDKSYFGAFVRSPDLMRALVEMLNSCMGTMLLSNDLIDGNNIDIIVQQKEFFKTIETQAGWVLNILNSMTKKKSYFESDGINGSKDDREAACLNLLDTGGITSLMGHLSANSAKHNLSTTSILNSVLSCLQSDPKKLQDAQNAILKVNGISTMVKLLDVHFTTSQIQLVNCLRIMIKEDQEIINTFIQCHGLSSLMNILNQQEPVDTFLRSLQEFIFSASLELLIDLSVSSEIKVAIIASGCVEALIRFMPQKSSWIRNNACSLMYTLSSVSFSIERPDHLALEMIRLLNYDGCMTNAMNISGIISNLTSNDNFRLAFYNNNGLQKLVQFAQQWEGYPIILENIFKGLQNLNHGHEKEEFAQHTFIYDLSGLSIIKKWVKTYSDPQCLKAALQLILNLASKPSNHKVLIEEKMIHFVFDILSCSIHTTRYRDESTNASYGHIIELCLQCISHFSEGPFIQSLSSDSSILLHLKRLQDNNSGNIQNLSLQILSRRSIDLKGVCKILTSRLLESVTGLSDPVSMLSKPVSGMSEPLFGLSEPVSGLSEPESELSEPESELSDAVSELSEPVSELSDTVSGESEPVSGMSEPESELSEPVPGVLEL